jgi:hypothetical protein
VNEFEGGVQDLRLGNKSTVNRNSFDEEVIREDKLNSKETI